MEGERCCRGGWGPRSLDGVSPRGHEAGWQTSASLRSRELEASKRGRDGMIHRSRRAEARRSRGVQLASGEARVLHEGRRAEDAQNPNGRFEAGRAPRHGRLIVGLLSGWMLHTPLCNGRGSGRGRIEDGPEPGREHPGPRRWARDPDRKSSAPPLGEAAASSDGHARVPTSR